jgi:4-hydroxyphenylpyruvate dioxygenase-like putative hemolysin
MLELDAQLDQLADRKMFHQIDHIAFAVRNLPEAVRFFSDVLGFTLKRELTIRGKKSGMVSAEMEYNGLRFVLCQGTEPESQVSRLVDELGPGVAHIALAVDDVHEAVDVLSRRGLEFDTNVIEGPGLTQTFTTRNANTGLCFEFIKREPMEDGFVEDNVQKLFDQLESKDSY